MLWDLREELPARSQVFLDLLVLLLVWVAEVGGEDHLWGNAEILNNETGRLQVFFSKRVIVKFDEIGHDAGVKRGYILEQRSLYMPEPRSLPLNHLPASLKM